MDNVPPTGPAPSQPGTSQDNDKLIAALCYPIAIIVSLVVLLTDMKNRPFLKYHAMQALIVDIVLWVAVFIISAILAAVTFGIGACISPILWVIVLGVTIYWAYQAYQGQWLVIPVITDFAKKQGWL
jgi:uncharacterized membrane protein